MKEGISKKPIRRTVHRSCIPETRQMGGGGPIRLSSKRDGKFSPTIFGWAFILEDRRGLRGNWGGCIHIPVFTLGESKWTEEGQSGKRSGKQGSGRDSLSSLQKEQKTSVGLNERIGSRHQKSRPTLREKLRKGELVS